MEYKKDLEELNKFALTFDEFGKMSEIVRYMLTNTMLKGAAPNEKQALIVSEFESQMRLQWQNLKKVELKPLKDNQGITVYAYKFLPNRPEIYLAIEHSSGDYQVLDQKMADFYADAFEKPDWDLIYNERLPESRPVQASDN